MDIEPNAIEFAIGYAKFYSRSHDAVIRVYDDAGEVIETHEHTKAISESGERNLASVQLLTHYPSMEAEIDCKLQSNSRSATRGHCFLHAG